MLVFQVKEGLEDRVLLFLDVILQEKHCIVELYALLLGFSQPSSDIFNFFIEFGIVFFDILVFDPNTADFFYDFNVLWAAFEVDYCYLLFFLLGNRIDDDVLRFFKFRSAERIFHKSVG